MSIIAPALIANSSLITTLGTTLLSHTVSQGLELLTSLSHPHAEQVKEDTDIMCTLVTMQALVDEIHTLFVEKKEERKGDEIKDGFINVKHDETSYHGKNRSIHLAIGNIEEIGVQIYAVLLEIKKEENYHNTKWFSTWRTPNFQDHFLRLKSLKKTMDRRLDLLIKVVTAKSNINLNL